MKVSQRLVLGVVLAAEKKENFSATVPMFVPSNESGKLYKMDSHIMVSVSGIVADANYLIDMGRLHCMRHTYAQRSPIYVEEVVKHLANYKHSYTQYGSSRPFGVSLMYAGYDRQCGFQLYSSDPSGNYAAWRAHATGKNCVNSISTLKEDYTEGMTLDEGVIMAAKILGKSMEVNKPDASRFEIGVMTLDPVSKKATSRRVEGAELDKILADAKVFENIETK